jgi:hypothetical protein
MTGCGKIGQAAGEVALDTLGLVSRRNSALLALETLFARVDQHHDVGGEHASGALHAVLRPDLVTQRRAAPHEAPHELPALLRRSSPRLRGALQPSAGAKPLAA